MASPPACLATLPYVLFYFLWFLPLRPAIVARWTTPGGARVSKNIGTSFCSPLPIAPRARGHEPGSFVSQQVGEDRSPGGRGYRCWFCSWRLQLLAHGGFQRLGCLLLGSFSLITLGQFASGSALFAAGGAASAACLGPDWSPRSLQSGRALGWNPGA